jgi:1,5-anhydro-D-fructose reductase (1,5-anhydro-D-mannitol-forming)
MKDKNTPLRWGILGFGGFSDVAMAPAISAAAGHRLVAVWGRDPQRTQAYARKYGDVHCAPSAEALLQSRDLDAVYVAAPNFQHADLTVQAAERGLHVLCEKPMAVTLGEARRMIDACQRAGVRLMIGNMMRFNPCHAWIRDFVAAGNLGEILEAQALFGYDLPAFFPLASSPWRLDPRLSGGGAMLDVGVHTVDLLRWLIGKEVTEVTGLIDTRSHPAPIDWNSAAVLRFAGGALATVLASFDNSFRENYLSISGSRGSLKAEGTLWRQASGSVRAVTERGLFGYQPPAGLPDPYRLQVEHFGECIREGRTPLVDGGEGARDLAVCLAVYEAAGSRGVVKL